MDGLTIKEEVYPLHKNKLRAKKDCVERILNEAMEATKISLLLPRFFDEWLEVYKRLRETKYVFIARDLRAYCKKHILQVPTKKENYRDLELMRVIDQFQKHYEILKYFPDWLNEITTEECMSIAEFGLLQDLLKERFQMKAADQVEEERNLNVIFNEHAKVSRGLQTMGRLLHKNRFSLRWRIAVRETVFHELEGEVYAQAEHYAKMLVEERKNQTKRINQRLFTQRETAAEELLGLANTNYDKTCQTNLKNEGVARSERNKWLIQLQSLLKKYDQTMLDKFHEKMLLDEASIDILYENEQFMRVYRRAEKLYNELIRAAQLEEEQKRWEKIKDFIENRAARKIQLWYREHLRITKPYLLPKEKTKKKGKKGKKTK